MGDPAPKQVSLGGLLMEGMLTTDHGAIDHGPRNYGLRTTLTRNAERGRRTQYSLGSGSWLMGHAWKRSKCKVRGAKCNYNVES